MRNETIRRPLDDGTGLTLLKAMCVEITQYLDRAQKVISDEIGSYPTPIPRCDAQFNHLYEQRTRVSETLIRMAALVDGNLPRTDYLDSITAFVDSAPFTDDAGERNLKSRLKAALANL
jgi:hypothetical protein